jgi:hypothetical protein
MVKTNHLPKTDKVSLLAATILLSYTLTRFVDIPSRDLSIQLPGIYLSVEINIRTIVALLIAGLTATGADWLLHDHPSLRGKSTFQHWILPALTAWVIGAPLYQLPFGPQWWIGFGIGGGLLMVVLIAEFIVIDPHDFRFTLASIGLTAVSFALFFILIISLRTTQVRMFLLIPIITFSIGLISLRTLNLRIHGRWGIVQAIIIALVVGQIAAALHYLPLQPITFGLVLLGPAYALTSLLASWSETKPWAEVVTEPILVLIIAWGTAIFIR